MRLAAHGMAVELPEGWEGRIFRFDAPPPAVNLPVLHAADRPLTSQRSTYGAEVVASLGGTGTFMALVEFDPATAGTGLFAPRGVPAPARLSEFAPNAMERALPGLAARQRFFTEGGRAFCLYLVIGTGGEPGPRVDRVNRVLSSLSIDARSEARR